MVLGAQYSRLSKAVANRILKARRVSIPGLAIAQVVTDMKGLWPLAVASSWT